MPIGGLASGELGQAPPTNFVAPLNPLTGYNLSPRAGQFPYLHQAFANVLNKVSDAKVCVIGDSISAGFDAGVPALNQNAWAPIVAKLLTAAGIPASPGLVIPANGNHPVTDPRWTVGTGWSLGTGTGSSWGNNTVTWIGTTSAGSLVFTPSSGDSYDHYDVYYLSSTGLGTVNALVGGGSSTPINTSATEQVRKVTIAGTASVNNTITFSTVTVNDVFILGVEPFLSTTQRVRVAMAPVSSSSTTNWATVAVNNNGPLNCIEAYAANVWLLELGAEDSSLGTALSTVYSNYTTIGAAMQNTPSDIIGLAPNPDSSAFVPIATYASYVANLQAWCAANAAGYIDVFDAWGGANAFTVLNPLGYYADSVHPSAIGIADAGRIIAHALLSA